MLIHPKILLVSGFGIFIFCIRICHGLHFIGWWATGHEVTNHSSVIHEYYARECNNPVHLTVDTSLQGNRMGLKAYVCVNLGIPGGKSGCMFTPINSEVTCYETEVNVDIYCELHVIAKFSYSGCWSSIMPKNYCRYKSSTTEDSFAHA